GEPKDSRKFESFLEFVRASSRHHAVLLKPDYAASLGVLNPFLVTALLAQRPEHWPGVLLWSRYGTRLASMGRCWRSSMRLPARSNRS
ncbi:MAG: hypothetical protein ACREJU_02600, partial [Nitrospiraceae bacterium]